MKMETKNYILELGTCGITGKKAVWAYPSTQKGRHLGYVDRMSPIWYFG